MKEKEYLTVKEISLITQLSSRHIRRLIHNLTNEHPQELIHKNNNNEWMIHHLMISKFKPQRVHKTKYYALTIDPCQSYKEDDLHQIMEFIIQSMPEDNVEINYTIESKKKNGINHLHCFVRCTKRKRLIELIRIAFSDVSYREAVVYDLEGWKKYITKENANIITLKKKINHDQN